MRSDAAAALWRPLVTSDYKTTYWCLWPPQRAPCSMEDQRNSYAREASMSVHNKLRQQLYSSVGPALLVAMSLATSDSSWAACQGPGAPTTTQTKCLTAVAIPAAPANKTGGLQSFDISWVNPDRAEYYL